MALGRRLLVDADPTHDPRLLACSTSVTARCITPQASSQLIRKILVAPLTWHWLNTSMARRSKRSVNRDRGSPTAP